MLRAEYSEFTVNQIYWLLNFCNICSLSLSLSLYISPQIFLSACITKNKNILLLKHLPALQLGFPGGSVVKNLPANAGDADVG